MVGSPAETNKLTFQWFDLVNEKNTLLRFESELVIQSNSIQLEDRQARLEQKIRDLLTTDSTFFIPYTAEPLFNKWLFHQL